VHNTIMIASNAAFKDRHPRLFSAALKFELSLHGRAAVVWWPLEPSRLPIGVVQS
jgi:hypothetical protein